MIVISVTKIINYNLFLKLKINLLLSPVKPEAIATSLFGPKNDPIKTSKIAPTIKISNTF